MASDDIRTPAPDHPVSQSYNEDRDYLDWIIQHSAGAVTTRGQALAVLVIVALVFVSPFITFFIGIQPRVPAEVRMRHSQLDGSLLDEKALKFQPIPAKSKTSSENRKS